MAPASEASTHEAIRCRNISKTYGNNTVVTDVDLSIREGEIHALVGANGAGKSTVLGMLSGRVAPSQGSIEIFGAALPSANPKAAMAAGVRAVYQELTVIPKLSAAANVHLGEERSRFGVLSESRMEKDFLALCTQFGVRIRPRALAGDLPVAEQQLIEIMRAVRSKARVLLLDEPTASLSENERDFLLKLLRELRKSGVAIVLVSHNIDEVLGVSDTVTVMRNSRTVASQPATEWTARTLVSAMVGDSPLRIERDREPVRGEMLLEATGIMLPGALENVSLTVRAGEIVGLAGLVGSGRSSLLRSLAGAEPQSTGTLAIHGRATKWPSSVRQAIRRHRIALLPEDRKTQGLVLGMSVPDNVTITELATVSTGGVVSRRRQLGEARTILDRLRINRPAGFYPVGLLSGGNQQKVAIAKWLHHRPQILLADEPTRGIDVRAKIEVLATLRQLAREGMAVVIASSELEEVLDVSDRVIVLSEGRRVGEIDMHTSSPSVKDVLNLAFGV
ncbi:sugar ABC transporter ATP-binding protein [Compostimonas suwonensis]|uniref:Ribose transport system ATP-binding protein n=1 Tax=Compostimonas suwonensis TaxID=1048394 RepID=A0A2M9BUS3_9MICO|nr:sugar ABC transporter ATP-binding protein [Compostimonas suwonensis]PJJ61704.1 ribose transport system ATP-binding protein [Compostimonas suwonensis]